MTPGRNTRPLAYAPAPIVDEPLDAWIHRVARTLSVSTSGLNAFLGLPRRASFSVVRDLTDDDLAHLATVTGVPVATLHAMTLARWQCLGLRPASTQRGHGTGAWARGRGTRHCPDCLTNRDDVPRLHWHLHWSFACVVHHRLLLPDGDTATPGWHRLQADHPAIITQSALDQVLDDPAGAVPSLGVPRRPWVHMKDLAALTRMVVTSPVANEPQAFMRELSPVMREQWEPILRNTHIPQVASPAKRLQAATQQPGFMALAATLALQVLTAPSVDEASVRLWWLTPTARDEAVHHARSRQLSWPLVRALDNSTTRSRPARLLILRFGLARFDDDGSTRSPLDPAKVPAACWSSVSAISTSSAGGEIGPLAATAALLAVGSSRGIRSVLDRIEHPHLASRVRADWHRSFAFGEDPYFEALLRLHHALVSGKVPINYARRRRIFPRPVSVGSRKARRIARELQTPLTDALARHVSWYLHELLTGSNILLGPALLDLWATHRIAYRKQRAAWEAEQPHVLLEVAEAELLRHRIDEPVRWQPVLDGSEWSLPPATPHLLDGWHDVGRAIRHGARLPHEAVRGYTLDEAVALAAAGTTETARHLARNLNRFAAVAQAGSIKGGARRLGITPGTLSVQMSDLERDLTTLLLDRSGPAAIPTTKGRHLLRLIEANEPHLLSAAKPAGRPRHRKAERHPHA